MHLVLIIALLSLSAIVDGQLAITWTIFFTIIYQEKYGIDSCGMRHKTKLKFNEYDAIMNNDCLPASKLRKWLMKNKESTLPGLNKNIMLNAYKYSYNSMHKQSY